MTGIGDVGRGEDVEIVIVLRPDAPQIGRVVLIADRDLDADLRERLLRVIGGLAIHVAARRIVERQAHAARRRSRA